MNPADIACLVNLINSYKEKKLQSFRALKSMRAAAFAN